MERILPVIIGLAAVVIGGVIALVILKNKDKFGGDD
jgi:hypothetical protein